MAEIQFASVLFLPPPPPPHQRPAQGGDAENQRRNAWNGTATSRFSDVCDRPTRRFNVTPLLRSTNNAIRLKY